MVHSYEIEAGSERGSLVAPYRLFTMVILIDLQEWDMKRIY
jgi:hypothetical protein